MQDTNSPNTNTQDIGAALSDVVDRILDSGRRVSDELQGGDLSAKIKAVVADGESKLAETFNVPDTPEARAKFGNTARWAAGAGGLAMLLGMRSGRNRRKLAGVGALGALAFAAYKANGDRLPTSADEVIGLLKGNTREHRARALLTAMVAAAQVDGEISADERAAILDQAGDNARDGADMLDAILAQAPDAEAVAKLATSAQAAREIYAVSARVADGLNQRERAYLDRLAMALELDPDTAARIETDVRV